MFFFSPYFSTEEKEDGLSRTVVDADPTLVNFLQLLIEKHRLPVIHRIRRQFDVLWDHENRRLPVEVTSAVELDRSVIEALETRIQRADRPERRAREHRRPGHPGRNRAPRRELDPGRVDPQPTRTIARSGKSPKASLKERHADQARRDHQHPQEPHRGARRRGRGPRRGRHRAGRRRRHRAHARPGELHVVRDARVPARRDRPCAEPRVRQRRRRAVRRVGEGRRGRHRQAHRSPARDPGGRGAPGPDRRPARQPARRQGRDRDHRDAARRSSRRPAWSSASP